MSKLTKKHESRLKLETNEINIIKRLTTEMFFLISCLFLFFHYVCCALNFHFTNIFLFIIIFHSGVEFYQPTFLYAYVALLLQCGVLQAIGCLGALRLNQKLLNTYWTLLLVLMIGDIIVGLVWAFRLDRIKSSLRPSLRHKFITQYKIDPEFTQVWDWIQSQDMCCGVDSPFDFPQFNGKY